MFSSHFVVYYKLVVDFSFMEIKGLTDKGTIVNRFLALLLKPRPMQEKVLSFRRLIQTMINASQVLGCITISSYARLSERWWRMNLYQAVQYCNSVIVKSGFSKLQLSFPFNLRSWT